MEMHPFGPWDGLGPASPGRTATTHRGEPKVGEAPHHTIFQNLVVFLFFCDYSTRPDPTECGPNTADKHNHISNPLGLQCRANSWLQALRAAPGLSSGDVWAVTSGHSAGSSPQELHTHVTLDRDIHDAVYIH